MEFDFLNQFHFLRPEWFIALVPLTLLVLLIRKTTAKQSGWQSVIPSHLYQYMVIGKNEMGAKPPMWMLALVWIISVIALAGPTWERLPQPVYQLKMGHVIVIDMSLSMRATDMTPDRLTRAKYKAIDLVNAIGEGEMGLVAYAGDAFVISPLTEDAGNITTLIPSLSPEIMPVPGSDPLLGIESASELLTNAGYNSGMIYWITDGIELEQQQELQEYVASIPFTVNALTVGTSEGAPIRQQSGELLKDFTGSIVIPKLNEGAVKGVVKTSGGRFESFTSNDTDIDALASVSLLDKSDSEENEEESNLQGDQWKEVGPYLLLILLPFAAFAFKRGLVFIVLVGLLSPSMIKNAHALQRAQASEIAGTSQGVGTSQGIGAPEDTLEMANKPDSLSWWQTPFMNDNQEALNSYQRGKYKDAVNQFNDDTWKASSLYKSGDYEGALNAFKNIPGPESLYNQGNALAKLGKLEDAIKKYDQALSEAPDLDDAKTNKKIVEDLLKQQQQQNQEQNQNENGDDGEQSDSQDNGQDSSDNSDSPNSKQQSGDQNNQEGSNEQNGQQDNNEGQQSDQSQANDEQQSGGDNSQQPDDSEMNSQNESSDSQQQNAEQEQSDQGDDAQQDSAQAQKDEQQAEQEAQAMQGQETELTDAEKEELQRMESLMRRVPDDPAFLLKRKMQLEAQKRQRQRMPSNRSDW